MNRNVRVIGLIGLVIGLAVLSSGCETSSRSLRRHGDFAPIVGQRFELKVNCYVYQYDHLAYDHLTELPELSPDNYPERGLPLPVDASHIGEVDVLGRIIGVVPKGTMFVIEDVLRKKSTAATWYNFEARLQTPSPRVPGVVDARRLFVVGPDRPEAKSRFVRPVPEDRRSQ